MRALGVWALAGASVVCACADAPLVYNQRVYTRYTPTEFGLAAGRKELRTEVYGDPFAMGEVSFAEATLRVLNRFEPQPQPTTFTASPGPSAHPAYRMVLIFGQPNLPTFRVCSKQQEAPPPSPGAAQDGRTLHVAAAFCLNQGELTSVAGRAANVAGVDDPKFDRLLGQIVLALFPATDPNDERDDDLLLFSRR